VLKIAENRGSDLTGKIFLIHLLCEGCRDTHGGVSTLVHCLGTINAKHAGAIAKEIANKIYRQSPDFGKSDRSEVLL
jgi:hypothetical protein